MNVTVKPTPVLRGMVELPGSKSFSIRAFLAAACGGTSVIIRPSDCDDARVAISVARQLGAHVSGPRGSVWTIAAAGPVPRRKKGRPLRINVRESGTVLRLLLALLPVTSREATVIGTGTLRGRPNHHLVKVLRSRGIRISGTGSRESVPIRFSGGEFRAGRISIDGSLSSQFISALLMACPHLPKDSEIFIRGRKLVSKDYIVMTRQVLRRCGIRLRQIDARRWFIPGGQSSRGLGRFLVPSDYGLAAFLLAAGALSRSDLRLKGHFPDDLIQADGRILGFLKKMGVALGRSASGLRIKGPFSLKGGEFSLKDCPDLVPIMAILALFAKGRTRLYDIGHVRAKESDRITDLRTELLKIGSDIREGRNELVISPQGQYRGGVLLDPHRDHRLAMAFSVLGLKIGVRVKDIECVSKSYPAFVRDMRSVGALIK